MNMKSRSWLLLVPAILLLGISRWVLSAEHVTEWTSPTTRAAFDPNQNTVFGVLALILAVLVGNFLLFCGLLLGLLISLGRQEADPSIPRPPPWPSLIGPSIAALFLLLAVLRLGDLIIDPPSFVLRMREIQLERVAAQKPEKQQRTRGRILDVNGEILAMNGVDTILCADPSLLADSPERDLIPEIARLADLEEDYILRRIADPQRKYVRLRKRLPPEIGRKIQEIASQGLFLDRLPARDYPFATPLAHLVGIVRRDLSGLSGGAGIELAKNQILQAGNDVRLTLDIGLQTTIQQLAQDAAEKTCSEQVQIIVINPKTGAIRAAAQVPAIHGNQPMEEGHFPLSWRAVLDVFEPGGLIKPLVLASALDDGTISPDATIHTENGRWVHRGVPLRDAHPSAVLSPEEIIVRSSNIGMAKIGLRMGEKALFDAFQSWKLTEKASAGGLGGATRGLLYEPNRWSQISITRIPIGHECAFSLLQVLRAYTAFFNEGKIVEPHLFETDTDPEPIAAIRPETAREVRRILVQVVLKGTGKNAQIEGFTTFGKTAVVQKPLPNGRGYCPDTLQASFIGGLETPAGSYLIAVWLDEPDLDTSFNPAPELFRIVAGKLLNIR